MSDEAKKEIVEPSAATEDKASAESASEPKKKKKSIEYAVRLTNVVKRFGPKTAVGGVSLKIKAGSVYGLIGPNGAGKTTTFSMMAGFLKPTEGSLEVLGHSPTAVDALRSRLGVLPQDALLPNADRVGEFLCHMARLQNIPPEKVESEEIDGKDWWDLKCSSLSHGMSKRVAIAQAFLGSPEVVLLDEPTAGLDPRVAWEIRNVILARKGRCTLIVSSHNLQELEEICDAAAVLDHGKLVASGSMTELTAASAEIHVELGSDPTGLDEIRKLAGVTRVDHMRGDETTKANAYGDLVIHFEKQQVAAEDVISSALSVLLQNKVRISGLTKGRGLEKRVMELTD
jgi:ABC-2 type transport system ATP-binding protein